MPVLTRIETHKLREEATRVREAVADIMEAQIRASAPPPIIRRLHAVFLLLQNVDQELQALEALTS